MIQDCQQDDFKLLVIFQNKKNIANKKCQKFQLESLRPINRERNLRVFTKNNPKLEQIYLQNFKFQGRFIELNIYNIVSPLFQQIKLRPKLKVFTLIEEKQSTSFQVDQEILSRLYKVDTKDQLLFALKFTNSLICSKKQLFQNLIQSLTLQNVYIYSAPEQTNFKPFTMLKNFNKLKHLTLYNCPNIVSEYLININGDAFKNLQLLNVGLTSIDEKCIPTLSKMRNLTYLNVEQTIITGINLVEMFSRYQKLFREPHQLKKLNLKAKVHEWTRRCLKMLFCLTRFDYKKQLFIKNAEVYEKIKRMSQEEFEINAQNNKSQSEQSPPYDEKKELYKLTKIIPHYKDKAFQVTLCQYYEQFQLWLRELDDQEIQKISTFSNLFTLEDTSKLLSYLPNLQYLNICYHFNLVELDLRRLKKLKILVKDSYFQFEGQIDEDTNILYAQINS